MLRFLLLLVLLVWVCLAKYCIAHDYVVPYDNVPITAKTWEEVDIQWHDGHAELLRPIIYASKHGLITRHHLYIDLSEFGVPHVKITVSNVKPLTKWRVHQLLQDKQPVIGIYIHQTKNVRTYRFKDLQGNLSTIHATPNHPFYVTNLHMYVPISHITGVMPLGVCRT